MEAELMNEEAGMVTTKTKKESIGGGLYVTTEDGIQVSLRSVLLFLAGTLITAIALEFLPPGWRNDWNDTPPSGSNASSLKHVAPTFAVYGRSSTEEHLVHVLGVLQRLGYERVKFEEQWDLLWAHDYPFLRMPEQMKNLQSHQVVNHLPGCGFITNKVDLSTTRLAFLPRAFRLPEQRAEFLEYVESNPQVLFVEKHNEHRYINIRAPAAINLSSSDSFVQEYVQNPFLVDGYKFDIGVYVVITSVDPLRLYIYTGDVLFRYCPIKYYPFEADNVDKYVVGDDYLPTWELPSLTKYYKRFGGSMRAAFEAYVRDQSLEPAKIWPQVEEIVRQTVLTKEQDIVRILRSYKTRNFFELLRFDMIIDERLQVHLMEANMSPNLSSAHFKPNSLLYEQILYSVMNLVGIGSPIKWTAALKANADEVNEMVTTDKNIAVDLNSCVAHDCDKSCSKDECDLCLPCVTGKQYDKLWDAYREHLHRVDMKRIFPKPILKPENFDIEVEVQNMTKQNAWMTRWFYNKCLYEQNWCS